MPRRARWALLGGAILPATVLVVWGVASVTDATGTSRLPSPAEVVAAAQELAGGGVLVRHVVVSLGRLLTGFTFGSALGLAVGAAIGRARPAALLLQPTLGALRTLPSFAWLPLALVALGVGESAIVVVIVLGAFIPMAGATAKGFTPRTQSAAGPSIATGLRQALGQSWLVMIAAELLSSSKGIGFLLIESSGQDRMDRALVIIAVLTVLIKSSDALIARLERRVPDSSA